MHDFSGDNTMDADMLPSSTSDADWLQVENMMEDGDSRPLADEVDMIHGDVQEFEMRDAGEADVTEDLEQMLPEAAEQHNQAEPQDQEIQDASRAPTPGTQISFSQPKTLPALTSSDQPSEVSHTGHGPTPDATPRIRLDLTTSQSYEVLDTELKPTQEAVHSVEADSTISRGYESFDESSIALPEPSEERIPGSHVGVIPDKHDTSTLSEGSTRSLQPQTQLLEPSEHGEEPAPAPSPVAVQKHPQEGQSLAEVEVHDPSGVDLTDRSGGYVEDQVTQEEEEEGLIDPPPPVLLSYPFDGSHFALFNFPEDPQDGSTANGTTSPLTGHDEVQRESDAKHISPLAEYLPVPEAPILLFRERFPLYYEPLSSVFEALRADEAVNTGGRFDDNIELVISAPELDLTLPEVRSGGSIAPRYVFIIFL